MSAPIAAQARQIRRLKARLKRAAFFDKREREAAAGTAEAVDPSAGLPDAMVEEQAEERELA